MSLVPVLKVGQDPVTSRMAELVRRAAQSQPEPAEGSDVAPILPVTNENVTKSQPLPADTLQIPLGEPIEPQTATKKRQRVDPPHDAWVLIHQLRQAGVRLGINEADINYINLRPAHLVTLEQRRQLELLSYDVWFLLGEAPHEPSAPTVAPSALGPVATLGKSSMAALGRCDWLEWIARHPAAPIPPVRLAEELAELQARARAILLDPDAAPVLRGWAERVQQSHPQPGDFAGEKEETA